MVIVWLAIVLLCISAAVMWWKRRPRGSLLGVPPLPADRRALRGVLALMALGGVVFPLMGTSLLAMLLIDRLWLTRH